MKLPQHSLRELFWLVALVAMGCGWWVDVRYREAEFGARITEQMKEYQIAENARIHAQYDAQQLRSEVDHLHEQLDWLLKRQNDKPD